MIVLFLTIWHAIAELSLPAWQKEVRNIAHEVVEAMKEAKKMEMLFETMTLCMKYFCSVITNLNLHVEYLISFQKHLHSMFLRASRHRLAKENRQAVVDSCSSLNQRHVQVLSFLLSLFFAEWEILAFLLG